MNILLVHNSFKVYGGIEYHLENLRKLLENGDTEQKHRADLFLYEDIANPQEDLKSLLNKNHYDIAHFHVLEGIAPKLIDIVHEAKIPIVYTVHGLRDVCWRGRFAFPQCRSCRNGAYYLAALKGCKDIGATLKRYFAETLLHKDTRSISKINQLIFINEIFRPIFAEIPYFKNIPSARLYHFIDTAKYEKVLQEGLPKEDYIIYFGRLSQEKGIMTLAEAMRGTNIKLKIAGTGELEEKLTAMNLPNIELLGFLENEELFRKVAQARLTVVPSECEESFGYVIPESFALNTPVLGSNLGAIPELLADGRGQTFRAANIEELKNAISELLNQPQTLDDMAAKGNAFVKNELSPQSYRKQLIDIYKGCLL